jgi:hypothetical protein
MARQAEADRYATERWKAEREAQIADLAGQPGSDQARHQGGRLTMPIVAPVSGYQV